MKDKIFQLLDAYGFHAFRYDYPEAFERMYNICKPYTLTTKARMYALYKAVRYVTGNNIPGDLVECGVWKGGSSMLMALALQDAPRLLWMYDTYEGMPEAGQFDTRIGDDRKEKAGFCAASLEEVHDNMELTNYDYWRTIMGKVEDTTPKQAPTEIAILRLDTDYYESTRHTLEHLYPRLVPGGVLIIDDYGSWKGCRKAVDEYFDAPLFHHIDKQSVIKIKPHFSF